MKLTKLLALVAVCCLLFTVPAFAVGYDEVQSENAYWTEDNMAYVTGLANVPVSLYKRGEDGATSISSYFPGVIVEKQGEESNGYIKVRIGSSSGYFRAQDLTAEAPCTPPLTLIASSVEDVELYAGVAANAKVVAAYPGGTMLTVLGVRSDGWAHVLVNGQVG